MEPLLTVLFVGFIYFLFRESSDSTDNSPCKSPRLSDEEHKERRQAKYFQAMLDQPLSAKKPIGLNSIFSTEEPQKLPSLIFSLPRESGIRVANQFMSREGKQAHLTSEFWKDLKAQRLAIANHTCEVDGCTNTSRLECHHLDYLSLGDEHIDDVVVLCRACHQAQHDHYGYDRLTDYSVLINSK